MLEMVKKGSCPKKNECIFPHIMDNARPNSNKVCFFEMVAPGNCRRGGECRFRHDISDVERNDELFKSEVEQERVSKKPVCINEYRRKNSCLKGCACVFRHDISEQERSSPSLRGKMNEKWSKITGKAVGDNKVATKAPQPDDNVTVQQLSAFMSEIRDIVNNSRRP